VLDETDTKELDRVTGRCWSN